MTTISAARIGVTEQSFSQALADADAGLIEWTASAVALRAHQYDAERLEAGSSKNTRFETISASQMLDELHGRRPRTVAPESPAEVWCAKCDQPSVRTVETQSGDLAVCATHAWTLTSPAWNTSAGRGRK